MEIVEKERQLVKPVKITLEVIRHAEKSPTGISPRGFDQAAEVGVSLSRSGIFADVDQVKGYKSPMSRSEQTLDAIFQGLEADLYKNTPTREVLLGFASKEFWVKEGEKTDESQKEHPELSRDDAEVPVLVRWLTKQDPELVALYSPDDAAADASVVFGRVIRALKRNPQSSDVKDKDGESHIGLIAITHRGAFEPVLVSGILKDENNTLVTDIMQLGGPLALLGRLRMEAQRDGVGNITSQVILERDGSTNVYTVDMTKLDELYQKGIQLMLKRRNSDEQ